MTHDLRWIGTGPVRAGLADIGAALWDLRLHGVPHSLVLGFNTYDDYRASRTHAGAIIGRVCNRLAFGRARIGDRVLRLQTNHPPHHAHGGQTGFSQMLWDVIDHQPDSLTYALTSPDGHEGYPGDVQVQARYWTTGQDLVLDLSARTSAPTVLNLCHHPYFNLTGNTTLSAHQVQVLADEWLETDPTHCPTGRVLPVADSPADLKTAPVALTDLKGPTNRTYVLGRKPLTAPRLAAVLDAGVRVQVWTTQTALQVYDSSQMQPGLTLRDNRLTTPRMALCLEPQGWTDAPNHPDFPSVVLSPGDRWVHRTLYRLSADDRDMTPKRGSAALGRS